MLFVVTLFMVMPLMPTLGWKLGSVTSFRMRILCGLKRTGNSEILSYIMWLEAENWVELERFCGQLPLVAPEVSRRLFSKFPPVTSQSSYTLCFLFDSSFFFSFFFFLFL